MNTIKTETIHPIKIPTPFLVGTVNAYLIKGEQNILVDTGPATVEAEEALRSGLAEAELKIHDIDQLILTHHHPDHVGLAYLFSGSAVISGHKKLRPWLSKDEAHYKNVYQFFEAFYQENGMEETFIQQIKKQHQSYMTYVKPAELHKEVSEEEGTIQGLTGWKVLETPGHAQTHISLIRKEDGVLIAGDHIISHISSNAILEAPYSPVEKRPETLLQYRDSLKKCLQASIVYSGHGKRISAPKELIIKRLESQLSKAEMFYEKIGTESFTVMDLCRKVYPEIFMKQPDLTFSETQGHLDLLQQEERVKKHWKDGKLYYSQHQPVKQ
ncbi:MBL fold metallo-hydrolase [Alkalicoccus daliensis]|uniref:Glyoxylase, beta-lactamase superfamily II n=1 Tax=Alkalicoccus daliensis TaxID=745820 RepID=A0A1H0DWA4_9BACI|nr:MBL fold metallo-hydrolase [Alkalicoccus daliensis]SDN74281.1 Glyoxylase, beta-lactamase superfamily II [Alkalicoccus daliensis]